MELLLHLLSNDATELPTVNDGTIVYLSLLAGHAASQQWKILIYYEYPMLTVTIELVMNIYGLFPLF